MKTSESVLQRSGVVCLLALICCFLWGSAFPCVKLGYELFAIAPADTASQILFAGLRFFLAGWLTVGIGSLLRRKLLFPGKSSWGMVGALSLAQTVVQYLFFYIGLANTSGVKGSIIVASSTFFAIFISSLICHYEPLGAGKLLGCLLGFGGVVVINLSGGDLGSSIRLTGEGFMLISTLSNAASVVLMKGYSRREDPVTLSGWQFVLGGFAMIAVGLFMGGRLTVRSPWSLLLLLYMAMISAVAYSLWGILLKYNPVGRVTVYGFMTPVFGVVLSAVLLGEQNQAFTLSGLAALLLVCLGIWSVNRETGK